MDPTDPKSYRPISNLSVASKLLERPVCHQLVTYLKTTVSVFRVHHSTEAAVLKVMSDILLTLDCGNLALLTLLDLSATFDNVDHATLIQCLQKSYGLGDVALKWITLYLIYTVCPNVCDHFPSRLQCCLVYPRVQSSDLSSLYSTLQMYCSL